MALIPVQHVVADMYNVDPDFTADTIMGMAVRLIESGSNVFVGRLTAGTQLIFGIAGDTQSDTTAGTPYAADLVVGSHRPDDTAKTRSTENRVSDFFNETLASGKMTVYTGGGRFLTDQYDATDTYVIGGSVGVVGASGLWADDGGHANSTNNPCVCVAQPAAQPSGVPGTDTSDGSLSLGTYIELVLHIL
tara:strand:- start:694 stop:1266 length:573 start_codon:yes stop_codon:yes gene_type:complete